MPVLPLVHTLSGSHGFSRTVVVVVDTVVAVVAVVVVDVVVGGTPLMHLTNPSEHSPVPSAYSVQTSRLGR